MQEIFAKNAALKQSLKVSLSSPRFARYNAAAKGDDLRAIAIYHWNVKLSQSLYTYLQAWEICFRNRMNEFLCWKYNCNWPYDERRARRQLTRMDQSRLQDAIVRQEKTRGLKPAPLPAIVADLSAGFWVSQVSKSYEIPYAWRHNLARIFPHDRALDMRSAWTICDELLTLRNRIAHHEPIFYLPLEQRHRDLQRAVAAMCPGTHAFAEASCAFMETWNTRP
ncbi:conserved protein of unknown function, DUF1526 [Methylorubrum extorquens DM4]|uniref:Abi-like protein n=1 Tax=Methylorubrum extorquens (strain DSM 6343 / CIP 106787 / DM4) TaxID=661410 RepID=C7CFT5_METED|nr:conserved protein of unknown function, DUF1526 [Methylorubrum extorquens DM4]